MTQRYSYIAIGANLPPQPGGAKATLTDALKAFAGESLTLVGKSPWYHTPAFPAGIGPDFVNAVVRIVSELTAQQVMAALHRIEAELGRTRGQRWAARVCDLDLLDCDGEVSPNLEVWQPWRGLSPASQATQTPDQLILPHPRMQDRAFVLVPLAEIAPDWRHPVLGETARELRDKLPIAEIDQIRVIDEA